MNNLATVALVATARQEIKKSRFLAVAGPVENEAAAKEFVAAHSQPTANHNCWAWRVGQAYRFSDDGEPSGTAGKPILQAIDGQSLDRVAVVVTRWFGGVLLGSGGLIRAYGGTAAICLKDAEKTPLIDRIAGVVICAFGDLSLLRARLEEVPDLQVQLNGFTDTGAELGVSIPVGEVDLISHLVMDLTSGRATLKIDG